MLNSLLGVPFTVTVDSSDLPGNMAPTHDFDDRADVLTLLGTANSAVVTLTSGSPEELTVNFGYRGLGELGDTVWLDVDASGDIVPQLDNVLLPNIGVTLVWTNPNGGSAFSASTTTAADGTYAFEHLPDGDYTLTIDDATLPGGVVPIVDPDGGADHSSAVTLDDDPLTPSINEGIDLDQDFAYAGTGSLGDTVWHDLDADGVPDAGETGFSSVTVQIVWSDPITGVTVAVTTATDTHGTYGFTDLPAGNYAIAIDALTLPAGTAPTFDLDAVLDRATIRILGPAENANDVDFGERLEADLAVAKSHSGDFAVGAENSWTISVTNNVPATATGPVTVTDTLPAGINYVRAEATGWTCSHAAGTVACTLDAAAMAVGVTTSFELVVIA